MTAPLTYITTIASFTVGILLLLFGLLQKYDQKFYEFYLNNFLICTGISIIFITTLINYYGRSILNYIKQVSLRPYINWIDVIIVTAVSTSFTFYNEKYWLYITIFCLFLYFLLNIIFHYYNKEPNKQVLTNIHDPIDTPDKDILYREGIIDQLYRMISNPQNNTRVFAVTGKSGIGKTSVAKMLLKKISDTCEYKYYLIYFDAHFYKNSYQLLQALSSEIYNEIIKHQYLPSEFNKIFERIIDFIIDQTKKQYLFNLRIQGNKDIEKSTRALKNLIKHCKRPIILIIDDIDRIGKEELSALLNVIRLLKSANSSVDTPPRLLQILCYNRNHVDQHLYGDSSIDRQKSQQSLAKIVEKEFSIPALTEKFAKKGLYIELKVLINQLEETQKKEFKDYLEKNLSLLCKNILTMRQARKIIQHTIDLFIKNKDEYNPWDLFNLNVIRYCYPDAYDLMEKYPEWFHYWNGQPNEIQETVLENIGSTNDKYDDKYTHYAKIRDAKLLQLYPDCIDQDLLGQSLRMLEICTILGSKNILENNKITAKYKPHLSHITLPKLDEENRLCHPNHYLHYFNHTYLENEITMTEIIRLLDNINNVNFKNEFKEKIQLHYSNGSLYQFLDRWTVKTKNRIEKWNKDMLITLAESLAECSNVYVQEEYHKFNHESHLAFRYITKIIRTLSTHPFNEATNLTVYIIKNSPSLYFVGLFIFYANNPDREEFPANIIDMKKINAEFSNRIKNTFIDKSLFSNPDKLDFVAISLWLQDQELKKQYLLRDLKNEPNNIFNLIEISLLLNGQIDQKLFSYIPFLNEVYQAVHDKIEHDKLSKKHKSYWESFKVYMETQQSNLLASSSSMIPESESATF